MGSQLPYWQVNVPEKDRTTECPDFLANLNDKNTKILLTPDSEYKRLSWIDVKHIVSENRLDAFQRVPSDLRLYLQYTYKLKQEWGSVMDFVLKERIKWHGDMQSKSNTPFANASDVKILFNDWPYGIDEDIVHLVVWTKFELAENPETGDLSDEARAQIDDFVGQTFRSKMPAENVAWFKNWKSLKSVEAVEHFHVLLNKPDKAFLAQLTGNDIALQDKIKAEAHARST